MPPRNIWKLLFLFFFIITSSGCEEKTSVPEGAAEVRYVAVANERVILTNDLPGRVSALAVPEARPQVDGIILERLFEEGADVVKGQVLYQSDPRHVSGGIRQCQGRSGLHGVPGYTGDGAAGPGESSGAALPSGHNHVWESNGGTIITQNGPFFNPQSRQHQRLAENRANA